MLVPVPNLKYKFRLNHSLINFHFKLLEENVNINQAKELYNFTKKHDFKDVEILPKLRMFLDKNANYILDLLLIYEPLKNAFEFHKIIFPWINFKKYSNLDFDLILLSHYVENSQIELIDLILYHDKIEFKRMFPIIMNLKYYIDRHYDDVTDIYKHYDENILYLLSKKKYNNIEYLLQLAIKKKDDKLILYIVKNYKINPKHFDPYIWKFANIVNKNTIKYSMKIKTFVYLTLKSRLPNHDVINSIMSLI